MLQVLAPAKINLTLEVLGKRPDGFHEVRSVIQAISLFDSLWLQPSDGVVFKSDRPDWRAEESLVSRAVILLQQATGCSKGITVEVEKRVPLSAGLGGDSSDAAAILLGLNQLWEVNLPLERLAELARQLGSDVSFFLYDGTALVEGRGERVTPLPPLSHRWLVLVMPAVPPLPEKTRQLYQSLSVNHYTDGQTSHRLVEAIRAGEHFPSSMLFNTFENIADTRFPGLAIAREHFLKMGTNNVHLAGTGPALFTVFEDRARAEDLYALLQNQRMQSYLAETLPAVGSIEHRA